MTDDLARFDLISRREYARRKGMAPSGIVEAVAAGRISLWIACPSCRNPVKVRAEACDCGQLICGQVDPRAGKIIEALADDELRQHADPSRDYLRAYWAERRGVQPEDPRPQASVENGTVSFADVRTQRELLNLKLAQVEFAKRAGELCEVTAVQAEAARQARLTRDALLAVPDRLALVIAAEPDAARVHALLRQEIERVLTSIADGTSALERDEPR